MQHILDAIDRIETYLEGSDESRFLKSPEKQDAVIRRLQVLGEAVKRLSDEARSTVRAVPVAGRVPSCYRSNAMR